MRLNSFVLFGLTAILVSITGLILLFSNVLLVELNYQLKKKDYIKPKNENKIVLPAIPVNKNFSIIIPKININSKVLTNVNPAVKKEYLEALSKGVAHAKGTALPNEKGNTFIFAHSTTANIIDVNRYNAIFYLLGKLEKDDLIYVVYKGKNYQYKVSEIKIVDVNRVEFLNKNNDDILTLMTCWPPGTTLKRLLLIARKT